MSIKATAINLIIGADIAAFESQMRKLQRETKKLGKQLSDVGKNLTLGLTVPLAGLGAASLKSAAEIDTLKRALVAVMGTSEAAEKEFIKLKEVAKLPGLGLEDAVQGSVNLQAAGFSADQARRSLMAFGNALATVGKGKDDLAGVNLVLTQMLNKPKVMQQDLNQLFERLPQVRRIMQEAFGATSSEDLQKLGLSGKQFVDGLITEFEKLPRMTGGLKNSFENFSDSVQVSLATFGESINKAFNIEGLLNKAGDLLADFADWFSRLNPTMQKTILIIAGVVAAIGPLLIVIGALVQFLPTLILGFKTLSTVFSLATLKIIAIGAAVAGLAAAAYVIYQAWDGVKDFFKGVWQGIQGIFYQGVANNLKALNALSSFFGLDFTDTINEFEGKAKTKFDSFSENTSKGFGRIVDEAVKAKDAVLDLFTLEPKKEVSSGGLSEVVNVENNTSTGSGVASVVNTDFSIGNMGGGMSQMADGLKIQESMLKESLAKRLITQQEFDKLMLENQIAQIDQQLLTEQEGTLAYQELLTQKAELEANYENNAVELVKKAEEAKRAARKQTFDDALMGLSQLAGAFQEFGNKSKALALFEIAANTAMGISRAVAAGAGLIFPANIGAIASGVASVVSGAAKAKQAFQGAKFADGGIVSGPTIGMVGEYAGARNNPEVISPLNKLKKLIGDNGGNQLVEVIGNIRVQGQDLLIAIENANKVKMRMA